MFEVLDPQNYMEVKLVLAHVDKLHEPNSPAPSESGQEDVFDDDDFDQK